VTFEGQYVGVMNQLIDQRRSQVIITEGLSPASHSMFELRHFLS